MRGLYIGKFQPFHIGHLKTFEFLSSIADSVIIGLGSPQNEEGFNLHERIEMIERNTQLSPIILEDLTEDHPFYWDWGSYVLGKVGQIDIVASGNSYVRDDFVEHHIPVIWMPRFYNISGTTIRNKISKRDNSWRSLVTKASEEIIKNSDFYGRNYDG